uniref:C2 domain-containing protein n=1 Tax=Oncorhynchus kisutch TaxID=8019 RepID=A0A8C7MV07_ONCKI
MFNVLVFFLLRSPFYGEDFYCEIPRSFRHLSFYIFDRDVFRRDSSIGKVAVKKEDLQRYHGKDTWFPLRHVSADSEVQVCRTENTHTHKHTHTHTQSFNLLRRSSILLSQDGTFASRMEGSGGLFDRLRILRRQPVHIDPPHAVHTTFTPPCSSYHIDPPIHFILH